MTPTVENLLTVCEEAARAGGAELLAWVGRFTPREKSPRDLVTDADLASEKAIRDILTQNFPEHGILGEESPRIEELEREYCWVVDPLDGTTNYVHGYPCFATSIAVAHRGKLLAGVVFDPVREECFSGAIGTGARLNGQLLKVSSISTLAEALLAVSLPANVTPESPDVNAMLNCIGRCQAVRRTGSAALNLAYVACGRLDGHWAHDTHPWDAAAGVLLIQEAGGMATGSDGKPFDLAAGNYLAAGTPSLHTALLQMVKR